MFSKQQIWRWDKPNIQIVMRGNSWQLFKGKYVQVMKEKMKLKLGDGKANCNERRLAVANSNVNKIKPLRDGTRTN